MKKKILFNSDEEARDSEFVGKIAKYEYKNLGLDDVTPTSHLWHGIVTKDRAKEVADITLDNLGCSCFYMNTTMPESWFNDITPFDLYKLSVIYDAWPFLSKVILDCYIQTKLPEEEFKKTHFLFGHCSTPRLFCMEWFDKLAYLSLSPDESRVWRVIETYARFAANFPNGKNLLLQYLDNFVTELYPYLYGKEVGEPYWNDEGVSYTGWYKKVGDKYFTFYQEEWVEINTATILRIIKDEKLRATNMREMGWMYLTGCFDYAGTMTLKDFCKKFGITLKKG